MAAIIATINTLPASAPRPRDEELIMIMMIMIVIMIMMIFAGLTAPRPRDEELAGDLPPEPAARPHQPHPDTRQVMMMMTVMMMMMMMMILDRRKMKPCQFNPLCLCSNSGMWRCLVRKYWLRASANIEPDWQNQAFIVFNKPPLHLVVKLF